MLVNVLVAIISESSAMKSIILAVCVFLFSWSSVLRADAPATQAAPEIAYEQVNVSGGPWKIWFKQHLVDRGNYTLKLTLLEIASPKIKVAFITDNTWCVYRIMHAERMMNSPTGGTGTVVHWDGKPVGTVHGGEVVQDVALSVDGNTIPLLGNQKPVFDRKAIWSGGKIILKKTSLIGPFKHEAEFEFGADQSSYAATHRYEVVTQITPERFKGYRYVFMQMMPPEFSEWVRFGADDKAVSGQLLLPDEKAKTRDRAIWNERVRAVACYAPDWQAGIVYAYPELYEGLSHLVDRGRKDRKYRGILFTKDKYDVGEKLEWRMRCTVFDAAADQWRSKSETLARQP